MPWGAIATAGLQAGIAATTIIFQTRAAAEADRSARREAARERQFQLDLIAQQRAAAAAAAKARAAQAAVTAGATGGAVAYDARGQLLPASGVAAPGSFTMPGGISRNMMIVGVIGVLGIGAIALMGRRR